LTSTVRRSWKVATTDPIIQFREELCFRYLNQFVQNGKLETKVSRNLITECRKIKGFASAAGRFIAASTGRQYLIS
jgi:glycosyltransferase-like protein LARGE